MKIDRVTIRYGELRSTGWPEYSNRRYEVEVSAIVDHENGDTPEMVRRSLTEHAKRVVKIEFGDKVDDEMPF